MSLRLALQRLLRSQSRATDGSVRDTNILFVCLQSKLQVFGNRRQNKKEHLLVLLFVLVRSPRLELGRVHHTPLKRRRLPIPP